MNHTLFFSWAALHLSFDLSASLSISLEALAFLWEAASCLWKKKERFPPSG